MKKICPRCKDEFNCRQDRSELCRCMHVYINVGVREYFKQNYVACLCPDCLRETSDCFYSISVNPIYKKTVESEI